MWTDSSQCYVIQVLDSTAFGQVSEQSLQIAVALKRRDSMPAELAPALALLPKGLFAGPFGGPALLAKAFGMLIEPCGLPKPCMNEPVL